MRLKPCIRILNRSAQRYFAAHGRAHLPWRKTRDPYRILVSEIMLQQTQVERVLSFYSAFLKKFPTHHALAKAPLSEVLRTWQGLGYNRRAKFLQDAAQEIQSRFGGRFPRTAADLESLPGVGPYTARAVTAFAFDLPEAFIETNIRTAFLCHCFSKRRKSVTDQELLPLVAEALGASRMPPREFYAVLMDYGSYLKRSGVRLNGKSAHYVKQTKFEGSRRQLRGRILALLLEGPRRTKELASCTGRAKMEVEEELAKLVREGFLAKRGSRFALSA